MKWWSLLHRCSSHFSNCANDTKLRKASYLLVSRACFDSVYRSVVVFWIINDYSLLDNPYHLRITIMYRKSHQRCSLIIVCTPLSARERWGRLNFQPSFQKRGLYRTSTFRGGWLFSGRGCNFHIKNKLKCEMFNDKKSF